MQQQGDYNSSSSSYYQNYQSTIQNPNPNYNDVNGYTNSSPSSHASAPLITSSNFPNYYSSPYNPDLPSPPTNPNDHQPSYSFPHFPSPQQTQFYPYDQSSLPVTQNPSGYGQNSNFDENFGGYDESGVYAYRGGNTEPYGARGSESSKSVAFDDYGRPIGFSGGQNEGRRGEKVVNAVPESSNNLQDLMSGVQKFRVTLLAEGGGQNMDVLCQVGLDGIRMLDPATSRTLKIYPLETVTKWEVLDSHIFAFWSKSSIDIEPKRIRLKSNSYTTNSILDAVTAAAIQFKEMVSNTKSSDTSKASEQLTEKKKGLPEWMNLMKGKTEEKDYWVPDEAVTKCTNCSTDFGAFVRKHHCRNCGDIFCDKCTQGRIALTADEQAQPVRVCDRCLAEVTQRLSNASDAAGKVSGLQSHEDLAKKLQEEMDRKRQTSSGFRTDESGMQMREVACPTCTVHLKVQVPTSGSETIECGVCQNPFLVNAD